MSRTQHSKSATWILRDWHWTGQDVWKFLDSIVTRISISMSIIVWIISSYPITWQQITEMKTVGYKKLLFSLASSLDLGIPEVFNRHTLLNF